LEEMTHVHVAVEKNTKIVVENKRKDILLGMSF